MDAYTVFQVLEKIHTAGLLHGDISPENVLLSQEDGGWQVRIGGAAAT